MTAQLPQQKRNNRFHVLFSLPSLFFVLLFVWTVWKMAFRERGTIKDELSFPSHQNSPPISIILMGFPKSGSESFHEYFMECHALKSSHKYCTRNHANDDNNNSSERRQLLCAKCIHDNLLARRPIFHDCGSYQAYTSFDAESGDPFEWFLPQHFAMSQIARVNNHHHNNTSSSSLWILNVRDPKKWATNILHWYSATTRFLNSFQINYHSEYYNSNHTPVGVGLKESIDTRFLYQSLEMSLERARNRTEHERRKRILIDLYRNHTAKVTRYAQNHRIRLVTINVDKEDPIQITQKLQQSLYAITTVQKECRWNFNAEQLDNDWQNLDNIPLATY